MAEGNRRQTAKSKKNAPLAVSNSISMLLLLFALLGLTKQYGENVMGYMGIALSCYYLLILFFSESLSKTLTKLVKTRARREQYQNAKTVFHSAFFLSLIWGILIFALFFFGGNLISDKLLHAKLVVLPLRILGLAFIAETLMQCIGSYLAGIGMVKAVKHQLYLERLVIFGVSFILSAVFREYGEKVSALLRVEHYESAYTAMGVSIGVLCGAVTGLLYLAVLYGLVTRSNRQLFQNEHGRSRMQHENFITLLLRGQASSCFMQILKYGLFFLNIILYCAFQSEAEYGAIGSLFGKVLPLCMIFAMILLVSQGKFARKIVTPFRNDDIHTAREQLYGSFHYLVICGLPIAVYLCVMAENLTDFIFEKNTAFTVSALQCGSFLLVLIPMALLADTVLEQMGNKGIAFVIVFVTGVLQTIGFVVLLKQTKFGIMSIVYTQLFFWGIWMVLSFGILVRQIKGRMDVIHLFLIPMLCSAISGLIILFLSKALATILSNGIICGIMLLVAFVVYWLLILLFRGITKQDIKMLPWGVFLQHLGELLRVF
ncbi:MAG: hypothetical protein PHP50_02775 [Lachnospiraceae bacterium]|nr:hypothetical protein [Lachnospiraceae bacterium]